LVCLYKSKKSVDFFIYSPDTLFGTVSTVLIDPYGRVAASCGDGENVVTGDIDMDRLAAFRRKFPVLEDRDAWLADESWRG